jgi:hypothetical protein
MASYNSQTISSEGKMADVAHLGASETQRLVLEYGSPYIGIRRPEGFCWLALDGKDAIELTIRSDPRDITYFGVEFSREVLWTIIEENMTYGVFIYPPRAGLREFLEHRTI